MLSLTTSVFLLLFPVATAAPDQTTQVIKQTACNGRTYQYNGLAGYGAVPGNSRDKYGDTLGGIGSAIAIVPSSWQRTAEGSYTGDLLAQPDRGWNTNGTFNYNPRVHKFKITLALVADANATTPSPPNLQLQYIDTTLYSDPAGKPTTGLDGDFSGHASYPPGFPDLPIATFSGDGFGGAGPGGSLVPIDAEGLVFDPNSSSYFVSDEYGPYIYRFGFDGKMLQAIRPPDAFIPLRNGSESFSAASPPAYDPSKLPVPSDPSQGRANNQGFEGLTLSPDGRILSVLLQSALIQDGGTSKSSNFNSRLLQYDVSRKSTPLIGEYVVRLPTYTRPSDGKVRTAAQSEIHDLGGSGQFLVLARDSGAGRAADTTTSVYRQVDIFDISNATNLVTAGTGNSTSSGLNAFNASIASSKGVLASNVQPATYCPFVDYNINTELAKFGLHNGGVDNATLLNEKWESLALVPQLDATGAKVPGKWFIISFSDNDFITQDGYLNSGKFQYKDGSGASLDNQALVFDVTLPSDAQAWNGAPA